MAAIARSFPPVLPEKPKLLILGSMPGVRSLEARQYYAHPQNMFWNIMGEILSFSPSSPYAERVGALLDAGIALWDTLKFCERAGSLDSDIKKGTEVANDVCGLLENNPSVRAVFFNGGKAEQVFNKHIRTALKENTRSRLHIETLPSTSPANAGIAKKKKTALWTEAIRGTVSARERSG